MLQVTLSLPKMRRLPTVPWLLVALHLIGLCGAALETGEYRLINEERFNKGCEGDAGWQNAGN
jgi:hypothetical protein